MIRLFAGYDEREALGFHTFCSSVIRNASEPVSITAVMDSEPTDGSNAFTYARFGVAALCGYEGWAIFADACDMLVTADIAELWALRDDAYAVMVVKHAYKTAHPIKYRGTAMESPNVDYRRKNWSSLMLINCAAPEWRVARTANREAHQFIGFSDARIGELPAEWNVLVDEGQQAESAKILHWTAGIPAFHHYKAAPRAADWHREHEIMSVPNV